MLILPLGFLLSSCARNAVSPVMVVEPVAAGSGKERIDLVGRISNLMASHRQPTPGVSAKESMEQDAPVPVVPLAE
ncbi:hypothetical protein [Haloferula rosea]|uniref:Uncharacterized protein n=1 Tax=Haloferula rosea TaxID=490093 RepID=A0A934RG89_9BACT|nr:hypothetical protein [Haloferula rosea]MBK1828609.1 hypothetical protein [Haloferula rosea]